MDENELIEREEKRLLETGAMYHAGVDEDGEPIMKFNMDILKKVNRPLYDWWNLEIDTAILSLVNKGLVTVDLSDPSGMVVELTDLGRLVKEAATS